MNIRETLTTHRYYDRSNDIVRSLTADEIDKLAHHFYSCQYGVDYDEQSVRKLADNVIKKRIKHAKVQHVAL